MKKLSSLILTILMIANACIFTANAQDSVTLPYEAISAFEDKGSVLISPSDFTALASSGMISGFDPSKEYMSVEAVNVNADDRMTFDRAVKLSCHTAPGVWTYSSVRVNFNTSSDAYKSIKSGDTLLLKYTARATSGDGKFSIRLWNSPTQDYNLINHVPNNKPISSDWTAYYYPMTVTDANLIPNQIILRTSAAVQTFEIGDFELINYGTSVTASQLTTALADSGATLKTFNDGSYYIIEPEYKEQTPEGGDGEEDDEVTEGTETQLITSQSFLKDASVFGTGCATTSVTVSDEASQNFGLGFTEAMKLSCTKSGTIASSGITCNVRTDSSETASGDIVLLTFYAKSESKNTPVKVSILSDTGVVLSNPAGTNGDTAEVTYYIPTQWTKICFPITVSAKVGSVRFAMGSKISDVVIGGVTLEKRAADEDQFDLPTGYFLCEPYTRFTLDYNAEKYVDSSVIQKCSDIEINGDYIYAIGNGKLYIISTETEKVVGMVSGLGETRQLAVSEDGNTVVVTSRVDGAFVIAADDKTNPELVGRCDTVEYATGVAMADGYCYITNRTFGTEVIDMTDRTLPKNIANMRTGEAQSCEIVGTTLFAGCWGGRTVEAWDVSDPASPKALNRNISATGKGDGIYVHGNYLYVATGHSATWRGDVSMYNAGYGQGNGMDIYDISDIKNPVLKSSVRIEDHFYTIGEDYWDVRISENGNRTYAYFMNTFNGVYIYDVTNPEAPIRLAAIELTATKENNPAKYESLVRSYGHNKGARRSYYPFDTNARFNSPVGGVAVTDGKIYLAGTQFGVAVLDINDVGNILFDQVKDETTASPESSDTNFYEVDYTELRNAGFKDIVYGLPGGQVYSVDEKDGLIYAACGNQGIKILDTALNVINEYSVSGNNIVSEAVIFGNRLYTAEGLGGIAIYEISDDGLGLSEISRYIARYSPGHANIYSVKFIRLSPDGNYVLCDSGSTHSELVDFTDLENPVRWNGEGAVNNGWNPHSGLMYFRQLSTSLIGGRYLCSYGYNNQTYWYDFGEDPTSSSPKLAYMVAKCNLGMKGGFAALGGRNDGYAIGIKDDNSFFVFKPSEGSASTSYATLPTYKYSGDFTGTVAGKPTVFGDIMLLCERVSGRCDIIDISGLDIPNGKYDAKHITSFTFTGNPDLAKVIDSRIVFPLGNQGIISVSLDELSENHGVKLNFRTARGENTKPSASKTGKVTLKDALGNTVAVFFENNGTTHLPEFAASLPKGTYTLTFQKKGYLTHTEEITVEGETELPETVLIPGDIPADTEAECGDDIIDIDDVIRVLRGFSEGVSDDIRTVVDINEDGVVNVVDVMLVIRGIRMTA